VTADRGPASTYEIVWNNGHVERIEAHQVSYPGRFSNLGLDLFPTRADIPPKPERIEFHGEFNGRWQLVLSAPMSEITTIRNLSLAGEGL